VKIDESLVAAYREKVLNTWVQDLVLKAALYQSTQLLTFLLRDDRIAYIQKSEDLLEKDKMGWSTAVVDADVVPADKTDAGDMAISIVGTQEEVTKDGQYLLFILEVREQGSVWRLAHRYDAFFALSHELTRLFPEISTVKLPGSKMATKQTGRAAFGPSRKIDQKFIAERKTILWHFVRYRVDTFDMN
jgi:hypothetical protein